MRKIKKLLLLTLLPLSTLAQENVGIGTTSPDASAKLHVEAVNQGVLLPTLSTDSINAIASPATGLLVYDSTQNAFFFYNGSALCGQCL